MGMTLHVSTTLHQMTLEKIMKNTVCCKILLYGVTSRILKIVSVLYKHISCLINFGYMLDFYVILSLSNGLRCLNCRIVCVGRDL